MLATSHVAAANILSQAEFFIVFVKIQSVLLFAVFETAPAVITQVCAAVTTIDFSIRFSLGLELLLAEGNKSLNRQNYPKMGRLIDKITRFFEKIGFLIDKIT